MTPVSIATQPDPYSPRSGTRTGRTHDARKSHHDTGTRDWVGVDGEGVTLPSGEHRYVILGAGDAQIEDPDGLSWVDIFSFLESQHRPGVAFVGFYLGYDFTQWLKTLPEDRARKLLTIEGKDSRKSRSPKMQGKYLPVDVGEWQVDMLGSKRIMFRRHPCRCPTAKCEHEKGPWIYVCDAGGFFQTSFLNVINPASWAEPIVRPDEYRDILRGKEARATASLDDAMRHYNRLENRIFTRVMRDLDTGFRNLGVALTPSQWYGPGQAAQAWMRGRAPSTKEIETHVPAEFLDAARKSYFGGWFEIMCHGIVPGTCHEYDINSAYPHIISQLPCLLHGTYEYGTGKPTVAEGQLCLTRALVWTRPPHADQAKGQAIGAMLHRDTHGRISRPLITSGWYWWHELQAAQRARCITRITKDRFYEWVKYTPCDCQPPLWQVRNVYEMRQQVGKKTSLGKAAKLVINSIYGKTAQSVGHPIFANPVYASLITAGCRTMILDAISTHPGGKRNVVMVATDAVFFMDPHPSIDLGPSLGQWEAQARDNLTLFKPGVYWDDSARQALSNGEHPSFKARGINAREFGQCIQSVDEQFRAWGDTPPEIGGTEWPTVRFTSGFAMTSALQALVRNDWGSAGSVDSAKELVQNASPQDKRRTVWYDSTIPGRSVYRSEPLEVGQNATYRHPGNSLEWDTMPTEDFASVPYEKRFGMEDPFSDEYTTQHGIGPDEAQIGRGLFRILTGQE